MSSVNNVEKELVTGVLLGHLEIANLKKNLAAKEKYEGLVVDSKYGQILITEYVTSLKVKVKFLTTGFETTVQLDNLFRGLVKDKISPSILGVGVTGDEVTKINGKHIAEYRLWVSMLTRCYSAKVKSKNPCYEECEASENFKHFSYFKEWCNKQVGFGQKGWDLDKDLLLKGNKVYSEVYCVFLPKEINRAIIKQDTPDKKLPVGVSLEGRKYLVRLSKGNKSQRLGTYTTVNEAFLAYKEAKESYIKSLALKYKDRLDNRAYLALLSWELTAKRESNNV